MQLFKIRDHSIRRVLWHINGWKYWLHRRKYCRQHFQIQQSLPRTIPGYLKSLSWFKIISPRFDTRSFFVQKKTYGNGSRWVNILTLEDEDSNELDQHYLLFKRYVQVLHLGDGFDCIFAWCAWGSKSHWAIDWSMESVMPSKLSWAWEALCWRPLILSY